MQISTLPAGMRQELAERHAIGLARGGPAFRIHRRHAPLPAAPRGRPHGGNRAHARRRARHHLHLQPGGLSGGLQILHDRADGPGTQPHGRRDRRPGAAGGPRKPTPAGWRPPQHRDDGTGRTAAEPAQRGQSHAHSARPRRLCPLAAPHHRFHRRHHPEDRRTGPRTGAPQAGDFAQRLHRRAAAGTDADHAQVSPEGSAGRLQGVSAASLGEADLRIRAAEWRQR